MGIKFELKAKNSSGKQELTFTKGDSCVDICLTGVLNEMKIQIDFDGLGKDEINDLIYVLSRYN